MEVPSRSSTVGVLQAWVRSGQCWQALTPGIWAYVGYNGTSAAKIEGDGTTPVGLFSIGDQLYGNGPPLGTALGYHQLVCGDWWDEDPSSPTYNQFVTVTCDTAPPFGGGSEALWQITDAYQHFAVINYNTNPIVSGRGSAIFLHDSTGTPTAGCVSLAPQDLDQILTWLDPSAAPMIAIGTATQLQGL